MSKNFQYHRGINQRFCYYFLRCSVSQKYHNFSYLRQSDKDMTIGNIIIIYKF